ncbi:MAG: hypothetical protein ACLUPK_03025 [Veillonella sp.]
MPESIKMTAFTNWQVHQPVNLERGAESSPTSGLGGKPLWQVALDGTGRIITREQCLI